MEQITAEIYGLDSVQEAPRLSFCDLLTPEDRSASSNTQLPQPDHLFEFFVPPAAAAVPDPILFGKFININQKRDYFAAKSFRKPDDAAAEKRRLSASTQVSGDLVRPKADVNYHVQRVNFSALTSMSAKSRRRMFMFGPVKFKPEMELSAIKQRQATRDLVPAKPPSAGGKSRCWLLKTSSRGRSPLMTVLARSLGCVPAARGGVERWMGVAN